MVDLDTYMGVVVVVDNSYHGILVEYEFVTEKIKSKDYDRAILSNKINYRGYKKG